MRKHNKTTRYTWATMTDSSTRVETFMGAPIILEIILNYEANRTNT